VRNRERALSCARHSYAKQINSLKETNLYLPLFLSLSLVLRTLSFSLREESSCPRAAHTYVVVKNQGEDDTLSYLMKKGARCTLCLTTTVVMAMVVLVVAVVVMVMVVVTVVRPAAAKTKEQCVCR